jgi:hypothetical protein
MDNNDYISKVESIKKMYKEASKITNNQIFVVIVEQANYG